MLVVVKVKIILELLLRPSASLVVHLLNHLGVNLLLRLNHGDHLSPRPSLVSKEIHHSNNRVLELAFMVDLLCIMAHTCIMALICTMVLNKWVVWSRFCPCFCYLEG